MSSSIALVKEEALKSTDDDINVLNNLGYKVFPILNVDGEDFNLSKANQWLKERI